MKKEIANLLTTLFCIGCIIVFYSGIMKFLDETNWGEKEKATVKEELEICHKTKSDVTKSEEEFLKGLAVLYVMKQEGFLEKNLPAFSRITFNLSTLATDVSIAYKSILKYKCFKQTRACIESIEDYSLAMEEASKAFLDFSEGSEVIDFVDKSRDTASLKRLHPVLLNSNANLNKAGVIMKKASTDANKARADMNKYCD